MSGLLLGCAMSIWFVFAPASAAAEKKEKADEGKLTTPMPKKKTHPKAAPKSASDKKGETPSGSSATSKSKGAKSTLDPEPGKTVKEPEQLQNSATAPTVAITPEELVEFQEQSAATKKLIESSLELARKNLIYTYGSSDPATGGMDCSGFIYFVLRQNGFSEVPRDSSGQYTWLRRSGGFSAVVSRKADTFELDALRPGDLLFWTGTYATTRDPPISHVMLYLGTEKSTGTKVMIGSSDGRTYRSQKRSGVSVFDFLMPRTLIERDQRATFIGYGRIPGLGK